ncbi:MAG: hypothetical protein ABIP85_27720 [Chthoniobacteraceae bacterium]
MNRSGATAVMQNFLLSCIGCLVYGLVMTAGMNLFGAGGVSGGLPGPGLQASPIGEYAKSIIDKAGSKERADLQAVTSALTSSRDLLRLNTAQEYAVLTPDKLTVQTILTRLSRNPSEAARTALGALCSSKEFLAEQVRVACLLLALPKIHPLPEGALALLRKSVEPSSDSLEIAIRVLFDIGEKTTLELFAAQVLNSRHDFVTVQSWMRDPLLRHRRDPAVLGMCLDLLQQTKLDAERKNSLVEALFDYRPSEWYLSDNGMHPKPPSPKNLARGTRDVLKKVAAAVAADPAVSVKNRALAEKAVHGF